MKIVKSYPPNIDLIRTVFDPPYGVVFTYGDTLYSPDGLPISDTLMAHEETHARQQKDPDAWWDRYLTDVEFRISQEIEAYQNQYRLYCEHFKDRNKRSRFLFGLAKDLSGPIYNHCMTFQDAMAKIKG